MLNILGKRYIFFALSALLILPGLVLIALQGMPLSIDFKGGTSLEVSYASGKLPSTDQIVKLYEDLGITETKVTTTGLGTQIIRSSFMTDSARATVISEMQKQFEDTVTVLRFDSVGP